MPIKLDVRNDYGISLFSVDNSGKILFEPFDEKIGIKTTTPQSLLDINGDLRVKNININTGTLLADTPTINSVQTWNNAAVTFSAMKLNVTDTASAAASNLLDLRVGGMSRFRVQKNGIVTAFQMQGTGNYLEVQPISHFQGTFAGATNAMLGGANGAAWAVAGSLAITAPNNAVGVVDLKLERDGADTLAQRRGVNAQAFNVYNTFTDVSNFERARFSWSSNLFIIGTESAGTGSARALELQTNGTTALSISTNQLVRFGGTTSSFPALKQSSAALQVRLADDSSDAELVASRFISTANPVNTSSISASGYSVDGSSSVSMVDLEGTWNTTGTPTGIKSNIIDTASNVQSLLMDLQVDGTSKFRVSKSGGATFGAQIINDSLIAATGYSLTGTSSVSMVDLEGTWDTTGTPTAFKLNVVDTASNAASLLMDLRIGSTSRFSIAKSGSITLADAANIIVNATTGTKIGTATSQKLGFWNATPIVQPTTAVAEATFVENSGGVVVNDDSTFDGYTLSQIVKALRNAGLLA